VKKLVTGLALAVFLVSVWAPAAFAASAQATVVGSYTITDLGQGGWAGGALRSDGTLTGSGAFSVSTPFGQVVAKVMDGTWSGTLAAGGTVMLCANLVQIQGPDGAVPPQFCAPVAVNTGPTVIEGTIFRVTTAP
jgi:hypothetical protein